MIAKNLVYTRKAINEKDFTILLLTPHAEERLTRAQRSFNILQEGVHSIRYLSTSVN